MDVAARHDPKLSNGVRLADQNSPVPRVVVHLVRHGETDWNAERRIQGQTVEVPLNALGREQAAAVADELSALPIGALYSSDLRRALETAEPIAERLGLDIRVDPALRERDFGSSEGRLSDDVAAELGKAYESYWLDADARHPGGESRRELSERVVGFLERLAADPPAGEVVVVTSGGPIRMATAWVQQLPVDDVPWVQIANGSMTRIELR